MAPGTNVGAATPVQIGGLPMPGGEEGGPDRGRDAEPDQSQPAGTPGTPMEAKAVNDAVAYLRSLAEFRGRHADWAELAVRQAANPSAKAAISQKCIPPAAPANNPPPAPT